VLENLLVAAPVAGRESGWRPFFTPRRLREAEETDDDAAFRRAAETVAAERWRDD